MFKNFDVPDLAETESLRLRAYHCVPIANASAPVAEYDHCNQEHSASLTCGGAGKCNFHKNHPTQHHCPTCNELF
jgi:hypothetical protein